MSIMRRQDPMGRHDQGTESTDTRSWRGGEAAEEEEEAAGCEGFVMKPMGGILELL